LSRKHITKASITAKVIWELMSKKPVQEEGDQQHLA